MVVCGADDLKFELGSAGDKHILLNRYRWDWRDGTRFQYPMKIAISEGTVTNMFKKASIISIAVLLAAVSCCATAIAQNVNLSEGDTNPTQIGVLTLGVSTTNSYSWIQSWNSMPLTINPLGNYVGIGTMAPSAPLTVRGANLGTTSAAISSFLSLQNGNGNQSLLNFFQLRNSNGNDWTTSTTRIQQVVDTTPMGYIDFNPPNGNFGLAFGSNPCCGTNNPVEYMRIAFGGNVGIGTTNPVYKLDVAGQIHTSGSVVFSDGTTQSTAWTGSLCGGDYAESIEVSDDRTKYEPGDVLVIDSKAKGKFVKANAPYSMSVAGVYSTKPGVIGRRQTGAKSPDEIPMAVVGIVPTKVSAENGAIEPGDVLVTASTPGYVMKGTDRSRLTGAIVGKAMDSLSSGMGVIEVLISLQ